MCHLVLVLLFLSSDLPLSSDIAQIWMPGKTSS
jgi:hypothetical protein